MATNDFLPFAGGAGANVLTQADYAALAARDPGFGSGILLSDSLNKVLRQGTVMAAMLAQWIADNSGDNVVDDGTTASIEASLTKALQLLGLRAASTAQTGVAQLADNATAQALADALKVLTPATLNAALMGANQSKSGTGYQKLPGGLIVQWGTTAPSVTANANNNVTFPIAYPTAVLITLGVNGDVGAQVNAIVGCGGIGTQTGFVWRSNTSGVVRFTWISIGY